MESGLDLAADARVSQRICRYRLKCAWIRAVYDSGILADWGGATVGRGGPKEGLTSFWSFGISRGVPKRLDAGRIFARTLASNAVGLAPERGFEIRRAGRRGSVWWRGAMGRISNPRTVGMPLRIGSIINPPRGLEIARVISASQGGGNMVTSAHEVPPQESRLGMDGPSSLFTGGRGGACSGWSG